MIRLAELEQEVARRTGPFVLAAQAAGEPTSSTPSSAIMPSLQSNALLGGPENLFVLRRGAISGGDPAPVLRWMGNWVDSTAYLAGDGVVYSGGYTYVALDDVAAHAAVPPANASWARDGVLVALDDRERMCQAFDAQAGRVIVDRNWLQPMAPDEIAEFTHLHPSLELRPAVLAGLRRCFFEDRGPIYTNSSVGMDLTALLPWLTEPSQILAIRSGWQGSGPSQPFNAIKQAGHVILAGRSVPEGSWLSAARPAWSWVNEADSSSGPNGDFDRLAIDLDYAAAAAHIEAWHLFPGRMFAAAAGNLQASQEMAAREFTRQALLHCPQPSRELAFTEVVRLPLGR